MTAIWDQLVDIESFISNTWCKSEQVVNHPGDTKAQLDQPIVAKIEAASANLPCIREARLNTKFQTAAFARELTIRS